MEEVIRLLELKNRYYEKFYQLTSRFLTGDDEWRWEEMDLMVANRQRILNILRTFDYKIARTFSEVDSGEVDFEKYRQNVKGLLDKRTQWVNKIVKVDLALISLIDQMKTHTIQELKQTVEFQNNLRQFTHSARKVKRFA